MEHLLKHKSPNITYFNDFYTEYISRIKKIYDNYSNLHYKCDNVEANVKNILIKLSESIDKLSNTIEKVKQINDSKQSVLAILKEKYSYLSGKSKSDIYYSSLDLFDNLGTTAKHVNVKQIDYDIEAISSSIPHKQFNYNNFISKTDDDIMSKGIYFGSLYDNIKTFELIEQPWFDQNIIKNDNDDMVDIEYVIPTSSNTSSPMDLSIVITPKTSINNIDILYLSVYVKSNCFVTVKKIEYKTIDSAFYNNIEYSNNIVLYPSSNSKYTDLYIPIRQKNVSSIVIQLEQQYYSMEKIKVLYTGNRKLNILESLVVDTSYTYKLLSDKQWLPEMLNTSIGSIINNNTNISTDYEEMYRYYVGIRNIKLFSSEYIRNGELIFNKYKIDKNIVAFELYVDTLNDDNVSIKYFITFDDTNIWYPIVPKNVYDNIHTDTDVYRYYIKNPSTNIVIDEGMMGLYDSIVSPEYMTIKVVFQNNKNIIFRNISIREKSI